METYIEFRSQFTNNKSGKFWQTITKNSLIPLTEIPNKEEMLKKLYDELCSNRYKPQQPRAFIMINKGHSIARTIPVFEPVDICAYYYFTKKIESAIAGNRVFGTFGGWSLNGRIRSAENEEQRYISDHLRQYEAPDGDLIGIDESEEYSMPASFNPKAWKKNWKDFNQSLYTVSRTDSYEFVAELDIANFYDNINIDVLSEKLQKSGVEKKNTESLLYFLQNWGGYTNTAKTSHKGIPQDEVADCSRLIANYYLQDFDLEMFQLCKEYGAGYFRYADDQIVRARTREDLQEIIAKASLKILRHGLCFNNTKARIMTREEFEEYFSFEWFIDHAEKESLTSDEMESGLSYYLSKRELLRNRGIAILQFLLNKAEPGISKESLNIFYSCVVNTEFLSSPKLEPWHLIKVFDLLGEETKGVMISQLDNFSSSLIHNRFHYVLLRFYKFVNRGTTEVENRIISLRKTFGFV